MPCGKNSLSTKKCMNNPSEDPKTLVDIIKNYQETCSGEAYEAKYTANPSDDSLRWFMHYDLNEILEMKDKSIKEVITRCICNRKRHQYCISKDAVKTATDKLMGEKNLHPYSYISNKDFEFLYDRIKPIIGTVRGIGNSTLYDTCIRLGWSYSPQIEPKQYVYVHRELIKSAEAILGDKFSQIKEADRPAILRQEFINVEKKFAELSALDIENLLCIYHKDILNVYGIKEK